MQTDKKVKNELDKTYSSNDPNFSMIAEHTIDEIYKRNDRKILKSLSEEKANAIIRDYVDLPMPNPNYLEKIINFPNNGYKIDDKIKLKAIKKYEEVINKYFINETYIESTIKIEYERNRESDIELKYHDRNLTILINLSWIEDNRDFPTLWNNFIYIIGIVDNNMRLVYVSKNANSSFIDMLQFNGVRHVYKNTLAFKHIDFQGELLLNSYLQLLSSLDIRIEDMIDWFFREYLKNEFGVDNFAIFMPEENQSYHNKIKSILPEFERIFIQYKCFVEEGYIDQELIEVNSKQINISDINSFAKIKNIYLHSSLFHRLSQILFSNQSDIIHTKNIKKSYDSFYELVESEELHISDFYQYQIDSINLLLEHDIIKIDFNGEIKIDDIEKLIVLEELYNNGVLIYPHLSIRMKRVIDSLLNQNHLTYDNKLFSKMEHDYFNFYMNSKFSNGYNLRNRYIHSSSSVSEDKNIEDYYKILKLMIFIVVKINDDMTLNS